MWWGKYLLLVNANDFKKAICRNLVECTFLEEGSLLCYHLYSKISQKLQNFCLTLKFPTIDLNSASQVIIFEIIFLYNDLKLLESAMVLPILRISAPYETYN